MLVSFVQNILQAPPPSPEVVAIVYGCSPKYFPCFDVGLVENYLYDTTMTAH